MLTSASYSIDHLGPPQELFDRNRAVENIRSLHHEVDDVPDTQSGASPAAGNISSGRVLLLRNLCTYILEEDVEQFVARYCRSGRPKVYIQCDPSRAFIEFETKEQAERAYFYYNRHQCEIHNTCMEVHYADHDCAAKKEGEDNYRVLLVTVTDLLYPISNELICSLFSRFGEVQEVISFSSKTPLGVEDPHPGGYKILVSMVDAEMGRKAVKELNGRNIYNGCNTLHVQPTMSRELTMRRKQSNPCTSLYSPQQQRQQRYPITDGNNKQTSQNAVARARTCEENQVLMNISPNLGMSCNSPGFLKLMHISRLTREARDWKNSLMSHSPAPTPVLIVYNLTPEEVTVTELFNVFSIYGVVQRIKFLWDKPHTALVQYSDPLYASLAAYFLQNAPFFDVDPGMQVAFSRNPEVKLPPTVPHDLMKKMRTFSPQEQRYTVSEHIAPDLPNEVEKFVRGACAPTCTLFIANLREQIGEYEIRDIVSPFGRVNKVQMKSPVDGSRRRYAMVEMASRHEALYALAHLHNTAIDGSNVKVAFSKVVISDDPKPSVEGRPQTASTATTN